MYNLKKMCRSTASLGLKNTWLRAIKSSVINTKVQRPQERTPGAVGDFYFFVVAPCWPLQRQRAFFSPFATLFLFRVYF